MDGHRCVICQTPVLDPGRCHRCERAERRLLDDLRRQRESLAEARRRGRGRRTSKN